MALIAVFRKIMIGRLLPKAFSISSAPNAITSVDSSAVTVSFRREPLLKVTYYSRESPLWYDPITTPSIDLVSLPDLMIYIADARVPSRQTFAPASYFWEIAMDAILAFCFYVR